MKHISPARRFFASLLLLGVAFGTLTLEGALNTLNDTTITTWSRSQQFIITSSFKPSPPPHPLEDPRKNPNLKDVVRISAAELAVTSEKVKQAVLFQLDTTDRWKHRVRLNIRPWLPAHVPVHINSHQFSNYTQVSWMYDVDIPEYVERRKLLRALVQTTLLEMGNRNNKGSIVDVPMWFREGLIDLILAREGPSIVAEITPIQERVTPQVSLLEISTREKVWKDPLSRVRENLKITAPISFSDLSVPVDDQIASVGLEHFQNCSHLFIHELASLPEGGAKLRTFVQQLSSFSHPQFAFLHAFRDHFSSPLDVEKWWSLAQVNFLSREDNARWPEKNALGKLNEILQPQVQLRLGADALPIKETYTVQRLIEEVDFDQQQPVLRQMIGQLQKLQWNLPPDLLKLVYDYHIVLATYLHKREQLSSSDKNSRVASSTAKPVVKDVLKQLSYLEILREDYASIGLAVPAVSNTSTNAVNAQQATQILKSTP